MMIPRKHYLMKSDVREKEDMYILDIDLPGFCKEDIKAHVNNGYLIVTAQNESKQDKDAKKYIHRERYTGVYQRSFYIGSDIRQEDIKASYKRGVLRIKVPKMGTKKKEHAGVIRIA